MPLRTAGTAATLTILVALLVPACSGCATLGLEETDLPHTENYTVSENTQVTVLAGAVDGDIRVEAWGRDYVQVTWTRKTTWGKAQMENARAAVGQSAGRLDIETRVAADEAKLTLDYDIKVPRGVILARVVAAKGSTTIDGTAGNTVISAGSGDISVRNASGYLDIASGRGHLRLEGTTGGARLVTADGGIEVVNVDGDVKAVNSNGGITVTGGKGNVTLETSRGSIRVTGLDGSVLLARNAHGPIEVRDVTVVQVLETSGADVQADIGGVGPDGTTIRVDGGSISLCISGEVNADIELVPLSGAVAVSSRPGILSLAGEFSPARFTGRVGAGGNMIYAETSRGDINVCGKGS